MSFIADHLSSMSIFEYEQWLEEQMVAPRYDFKKCALTGKLTRVYVGGCVIDPFEEDKTKWHTMGECGCRAGECKAENQDIEDLFRPDIKELLE